MQQSPRLSQLVSQVQTELTPVKPQISEGARTGAAINAVSKTGSIVTEVSEPPVKTAAGDEPSPQDRNNRGAVKIAMPDSQKKVAEKSQRSATPIIKPELDTASLRQLTKSAEAQAQ